MPIGSDRWYLDTSAIAKLLLQETESDALRGVMGTAARATSIVGVIETRRAVGRASLGPDVDAALDPILAAFSVVQLDAAVVGRASRLRPMTMRTLDAIHLASALHLGPTLAGFVTYDRRLAEAASEAGLRVLSPA